MVVISLVCYCKTQPAVFVCMCSMATLIAKRLLGSSVHFLLVLSHTV